MVLTTIQSDKILSILNKKGIIWPKKREIKSKKRHVKKAYRRIVKYAREMTKKRYKTYPFWCSYSNIGINQLKLGQLKLTLDVPDDYILLSDYDKWVEYLDYSEKDLSNQCWNNYINQLFEISLCKRVQAIIPCIKKEWIIKIDKYL